jgi:hypothetical protein
MESDIPAKYIYTIDKDDLGNRKIRCITEYEGRIYPKNNIRTKYLQGQYNGIPRANQLSFNNLLQSLDSNDNDGNKSGVLV